MTIRAGLRRLLRPALKKFPIVWKRAIEADLYFERFRHSAAQCFPAIIRPEPRYLEVAITAYCNLRCIGCRYGRDFMPGRQLSWSVVRGLLDDAKKLGMWSVRLYGGEPLLHPDLPRMINYATRLGLKTIVTTNAVLLREKIDELHEAGLREITIGFYGTGAKYDDYVQRKDRFAQIEAGIAAVRQRYGMNVTLQLNWLLMRPSCNLQDLYAAWRFAERYSTLIQVDLIHYSLPYFTEGPDRELQFRPEDRPAIEQVIDELIRLKTMRPEMLRQSAVGLRSIPDWLIKRPNMRVPCDSHQMLWVGADGTVQQCYVTFKLGNLHKTRLINMVFSPEHKRTARSSFALACPNCHCHYDRRIQKHAPSARLYATQ
jgi:molybdenum cofactor biosynthesis enzyme MoaA